jgi:hypothetical protein
LGCPGSCGLDVLLLAMGLVVVVVVFEEDCANAAVVIGSVFDIDGIAIKLRIRPNSPIKVIVNVIVFNC